MAEDFTRHSALAPLGLAPRGENDGREAGVRLTELGPRVQLALRGDASARGFAAAVKRVLGVAPPVEPATVNRDGEHAILWLGPDEWLVVLPPGEAGAGAALERALARQHHLVSDVSHSRAILALEGPSARPLLMKGASLDFHPRAFPVGRCAQSHLARCHALFEAVDDAPRYHLHVHRSYARYAWAWLEDAGAEYGIGTATEQVAR